MSQAVNGSWGTVLEVRPVLQGPATPVQSRCSSAVRVDPPSWPSPVDGSAAPSRRAAKRPAGRRRDTARPLPVSSCCSWWDVCPQASFVLPPPSARGAPLPPWALPPLQAALLTAAAGLQPRLPAVLPRPGVGAPPAGTALPGGGASVSVCPASAGALSRLDNCLAVKCCLCFYLLS